MIAIIYLVIGLITALFMRFVVFEEPQDLVVWTLAVTVWPLLVIGVIFVILEEIKL